MKPSRQKIVPAVLALLMGLGVSTLPTADAGAGGLRAERKSGHRASKHHHRHEHRRSRHHYYYGGRPYYGPYYDRYGYWSYGYGRRRPGYERAQHYRPETRIERGYRYLVEGDQKRAVSLFAELAESDPHNALPKLGYAIAMSELHELELGVWAMRRAIRTDADAIRDLRLDAGLRPRVRALLDVYHSEGSHEDGAAHDEDAHFMVAALLWVLGDYSGAASAAEWALDGGDDQESTKVLAAALQHRRLTPDVPDIES